MMVLAYTAAHPSIPLPILQRIAWAALPWACSNNAIARSHAQKALAAAHPRITAFTMGMKEGAENPGSDGGALGRVAEWVRGNPHCTQPRVYRGWDPLDWEQRVLFAMTQCAITDDEKYPLTHAHMHSLFAVGESKVLEALERGESGECEGESGDGGGEGEGLGGSGKRKEVVEENAKVTEEAPAKCGEEESGNYQAKIIPWQDVQYVPADPRVAYLSLRRQQIVVVATLLSRTANLGGLARTCEIFRASKLVSRKRGLGVNTSNTRELRCPSIHILYIHT